MEEQVPPILIKAEGIVLVRSLESCLLNVDILSLFFQPLKRLNKSTNNSQNSKQFFPLLVFLPFPKEQDAAVAVSPRNFTNTRMNNY
jgi:hypothetical protein